MVTVKLGFDRRTASAVLGSCSLCALLACADNPYLIGALRDDAGTDAADAAQPALHDACDSHPEALVCSGFEREDLGEWPSQVVVQSAELMRSTASSRSGVASLHAQSRGPESTAVVARPFDARFDGALHLRVWLRVPMGVATETMNLFFIGFDPNPNGDPPVPFSGLDLNLEGGALQVYSPQSSPARVTGTLQIPRDRWFCLRVHVELGDSGSVEAFVDDAPALEVPVCDTVPDGGVSLLRAGIDWSSGQTSVFEVFMDDLVLSPDLVPCSAP